MSVQAGFIEDDSIALVWQLDHVNKGLVDPDKEDDPTGGLFQLPLEIVAAELLVLHCQLHGWDRVQGK